MHLDAGANQDSVQHPLPRLLTVAQAAMYLGYKSSAVLANIPVKPLRLADVGVGTGHRYDRKALDLWLDGLSGLAVQGVQETASNDEADEAFREWSLRRVTQAA